MKSLKQRGKLLASLDHFRDLDPRYLVEVAASEQHADGIAALLEARGAPPQCHLISNNRDLDGRELPMIAALRQVVGFGAGTIISCIPGRLGYYEGESPGHRFILARSG